MKKSLIALAVLASVAGVAQAQSSVQLYGIVDLVLHKDKGASAALTSGGVSGSRWGLKGSEDLGGGLKANFLLEQGFDADTGALSTAGTAFSRQSYVDLSLPHCIYRHGDTVVHSRDPGDIRRLPSRAAGR